MLQPWFREAKFGIFLHWGIYAEGDGVPGSEDASWPMFNKQETVEGYMARRRNFTADRYDPDAWADFFVRAGAKYTVLIAKHCDGFALWDTAQSHWSASRHSPAGRDLVGPYCEAVRKRGLKAGLYFSHSDWTHPDYASITRHPAHVPPDSAGYRLVYPEPGRDDLARWERYLLFHRAQLRELCDRYAPDLLWFDADWERDPEQWRIDEMLAELRRRLPNVVINDRNCHRGDYKTPEQGMPLVAPAEDGWELCSTLNDAWGYNPRRGPVKTGPQLIRMLLDTVSLGGNLLLNIAPRLDGTFDSLHMRSILELGAFLNANAPAIYGTRAGLPPAHYYGPSTRSADGRTLYLFALGDPGGQIAVKGLKNKVNRVSLVHDSDRVLPHQFIGGASWAGVPGVLWIDLPPEALQPVATAIRIDLDGPLDLYTGQGLAVTQN